METRKISPVTAEPPRTDRLTTTHTFLPDLARYAAQTGPLGPAPIRMASYFRFEMYVKDDKAVNCSSHGKMMIIKNINKC